MCAKVLLVPVLLYGGETMVWREEERSRIRVVQLDNFRSLLGIRRMDRVQNTWIRVLHVVTKRVDETIAISIYRGGVCGKFSIFIMAEVD